MCCITISYVMVVIVKTVSGVSVVMWVYTRITRDSGSTGYVLVIV